MTGAPAARAHHGVHHGVVVGGVPVSIATAAPTPGAALSAAARRLAEELAAARTGTPRREIRVASLLPSGRPVANGPRGPLPLSVSVSHVVGMVAAAVAQGASVGIDVVDVATVRAGLGLWLLDAERAGGASPGMLWAAKEAAYKAAGIDAPFRPLAVEVEADDEGFTWRLRDRWRGAGGTGRFFATGRHLVAIACSTASLADGETMPCS